MTVKIWSVGRLHHLMFRLFVYSYYKIYTNEYLNRDIVVYLKYDVKFT